MRAYERFLKYVRFDTQSAEESLTSPTTEKQFRLAGELAEQLRKIGASEVTVSDKCYVYAKIPATVGLEGKPTLGFIAHMDTSPDFSGENVNPIIHENYCGGDIALSDSGIVITESANPNLKELIGCDIITADGNTLLGADDKAGIAEIMTAAEEILSTGMPHGPISIAFTPDEEVGMGTDHFDTEKFGADFAYTVDGGAENCIEYENFNAAGACFKITGVSVHPGSAKGSMINAALVAMEINAALPSAEIPALTEGYEGFYHLTDMRGDCSSAELRYIIRDHDRALFEAKLDTLRHIEKIFREKYGEDKVVLGIKEQYRNMKEKIEPCMHLIDNARLAVASVGLTPEVCPIRGGTDGARLSFMGLPCPNLGTGGFAFHGPLEHISIQGMDRSVKIIIKLAELYSK